MRKNNSLIKKCVIALILVLLVMYIATGSSFADNASDDVINLDDLGPIETIQSSEESASGNNNVIKTDNTINGLNNLVENTTLVTNSSITNKSALPKTGSNTEIIFLIGIAVLGVTTIYIYKKSKIN